MVCFAQRRYILFIVVLCVTLSPAIGFLYQTKMPSHIEVLSDYNARFEIERNADFLIFWGVLFFTCIVGIIELLQLLGRRDNKWVKIFFFIIYFGLLTGIVLSVGRSWDILRENYLIMESGKLGRDFRLYLKNNPSFFDIEWVRDIWFEALFMFGIIFVFDVVFYFKAHTQFTKKFS